MSEVSDLSFQKSPDPIPVQKEKSIGNLENSSSSDLEISSLTSSSSLYIEKIPVSEGISDQEVDLE